LDKEYILKIADFGFARAYVDDNGKKLALKTECGTRGYMAPEVLDRSTYSASADIFSCGVILFIMLAGFPPFQFATRQDWWFHKLLTKKTDLFWKAHCRNADFSDAAKDIIVKMLCPTAKDRLTLDDILEHEWFNETVLSDEELFEQLEEKKKVVDAEKAKAKASNAGKRNVEFSELVNRSVEEVDAEGDDIPNANPEMRLFLNKGKDAEVVMEFNESEMNDAEADPVVVTPKKNKVVAEPPVYDEKNHIECYTQFLSTKTAKAVFDRVQEVFNTASFKFKAHADSYKIKVDYLSDEGEDMQFMVMIYNDPALDKRRVMFRRRKGDVLGFSTLYNTLAGELSDLVDYSE